jgi:hypothetical protein
MGANPLAAPIFLRDQLASILDETARHSVYGCAHEFSGASLRMGFAASGGIVEL